MTAARERRLRSMAKRLGRLVAPVAAPTQLPYITPLVPAVATRADGLRRRPIELRDLDAKIPPREGEAHVACPLCGHTRVHIRFRPLRPNEDGSMNWTYTVGQCPECELLYRIPALLPDRVPELYADGTYADYLEGDYSSNRRRRYRLTLDAFSPEFDDGGGRTLLDFGCGTGLFMAMAERRGFSPYGVDLAADSVAKARERFGDDRVFHGVVDAEAVPGNGFDVITMWSVLAHLPEPLADMRRFHHLLKPGGRLVIMTVNAQSLQRLTFRGRWNGFTPGHLMFWSSTTVSRLLGRAGFEGVTFAPFYGEGIERNKTRLSARATRRYRRVVDRYDCGNMLRVVATKGPARDG